MKKTGLLFGSFNPIHIGHTAVANYLCEFNNLDELWFVVTPQNPMKEKTALAAPEHRLEMVKLAAAFYPKFRVCDIEYSLPPPHYTINTLDTLRGHYPQNEFYLIIGADNWQQMPKWKEYERISTEYQILIYPRFGFDVHIPEEKKQSIWLTAAPRMEISSSFVREAIRSGKQVRGFVQQDVYNYIAAHGLYQS